VAAMHLAGVRGETCGAVLWTVQRTAPQGSPGMIVRILKFWF